METMKPTPQASFSRAGSYSPCFGGGDHKSCDMAAWKTHKKHELQDNLINYYKLIALNKSVTVGSHFLFY